jgi:hypothetical protein
VVEDSYNNTQLEVLGMGVLERLKKKASRTGKRVDQYQEAITFSEAAQQDRVQKFFQDDSPEENAGKLLVVGRESTFSKEVMDYALEMAQRLSYQIVALNTAPLTCETFKLFSSSRRKLCQDFQTLSEENVKAFKDRAEKLEIPFIHVVRFSENDVALQEINREFSDIEFVISDAEGEQPATREQQGERARQAICVYSMV